MGNPKTIDVLDSIAARHTDARRLSNGLWTESTMARALQHVRESHVDPCHCLFVAYLMMQGELTDWPEGPEWEKFYG